MAAMAQISGPRRREVLVVDDDPTYLASVEATASARGYNVITAESADEGMSIVRDRKLFAVLSDLKMSGPDGITLLERIRKQAPNMPLAIQTGFKLSPAELSRLEKIGASSHSKKVKAVDVIKDLLIKDEHVSGTAKQLQEENMALKALNQKLLADLTASLSQIPNPAQAMIQDGLGGSYSVANLISDIEQQNTRGVDFIEWWLKARQRLRSMGKIV